MDNPQETENNYILLRAPQRLHVIPLDFECFNHVWDKGEEIVRL
jgi:hypothetical protein